MKFHSVVTVAGVKYESYQGDRAASLVEQVYMIRLFRAVLKYFQPSHISMKQKFLFWAKVAKFLLTPNSKPYFYRPIEEETHDSAS